MDAVALGVDVVGDGHLPEGVDEAADDELDHATAGLPLVPDGPGAVLADAKRIERPLALRRGDDGRPHLVGQGERPLRDCRIDIAALRAELSRTLSFFNLLQNLSQLVRCKVYNLNTHNSFTIFILHLTQDRFKF